MDLSIPKNRIPGRCHFAIWQGKALKVCVIGGGEIASKAKSVADMIVTPDELGKIADDKKQAKKVAGRM